MTEVFTEGRNERPDETGIVLRGEAVGFRGYVERYGEPPVCFVGSHPGESCERLAVMEVYGISMCEAHGEEAAAGALEEIAYDLEQELQRPMNPHVKSLSPHIERALRHGFESLSDEAANAAAGHKDETLLRAFPLDHDRVCSATLHYVRDPENNGMGTHESPCDSYMHDRLLLCRHMRLAFEEDAHWLVETLEREREQVSAQAAYALALEQEAGLR